MHIITDTFLFSQIAQRFYQLMKLYKKQGKMET